MYYYLLTILDEERGHKGTGDVDHTAYSMAVGEGKAFGVLRITASKNIRFPLEFTDV